MITVKNTGPEHRTFDSQYPYGSSQLYRHKRCKDRLACLIHVE